MTLSADQLRVGILLPAADLYHRLWSDMDEVLEHLAHRVSTALRTAGFEVFYSHTVSTGPQVEATCADLAAKGADLLLVALGPYCPSGVLVPTLVQTRIPVLLWPMQSLLKLEPQEYDAEAVKLNHGVHAVQDLANVLRKKGRPLGVLHGHYEQPDFIGLLQPWVQAARILRAMQEANPIQVGGHFEHMLDLQVGEEEFIRRLGIVPEVVPASEFASLMEGVGEEQIAECLERYRLTFELGTGVEGPLLHKTARGEVTLRGLLEHTDSHACGLNFVELCNEERIGDGLHVAASLLMQEGFGYAGEGDWVTAVLVRALQQGLGVASFSEISSIGHADHRLLLRHWGEGNFALARAKPRLLTSRFRDRCATEFVIVDFEFEPGPATLVNLNSTPGGQGQLVSISGTIDEDHLPKIDGPRAVFRPERADVNDLLTEYAYAGGSHHLALVQGTPAEVLENVGRLAGWSYVRL